MDWGQHISKFLLKQLKTIGFLRGNLAFAPKITIQGSCIQNFGYQPKRPTKLVGLSRLIEILVTRSIYNKKTIINISAMLHASETWPLTKTNLQRLQCNDRAMIRQICSIKPEDVARVKSSELLAKLQLEDLDLILRERRLRWFGHVARSSGAI